MRSHRINVDLNFDPKFWAILPAVNINIHSQTFELEWLCFGLYIDVLPSDEIIQINNPLDHLFEEYGETNCHN